jgi:hypothetical protein
MYRVRRWSHDRDVVTEEFVADLDGIVMEGYVSVAWVPSATWASDEQVIPVLEAGPGGVRRFSVRP